MRLIDADELIAVFDSMTNNSATGEWQSIPIKHIKLIIDNVPTVEPDLKEIYQEGHYDGHREGYEKAINEDRPQGEWIEGTQGYYCSECEDIDSFYFEHNFCPNCGADMRGDKK